MDKKAKLRQALELQEAINNGSSDFVLLKKLDELESKIEGIKIPDNADIKGELQNIKQELEQELVVELSII